MAHILPYEAVMLWCCSAITLKNPDEVYLNSCTNKGWWAKVARCLRTLAVSLGLIVKMLNMCNERIRKKFPHSSTSLATARSIVVGTPAVVQSSDKRMYIRVRSLLRITSYSAHLKPRSTAEMLQNDFHLKRNAAARWNPIHRSNRTLLKGT